MTEPHRATHTGMSVCIADAIGISSMDRSDVDFLAFAPHCGHARCDSALREAGGPVHRTSLCTSP